LKLCDQMYHHDTYAPLWGASTLLQQSCHSVQYPLLGVKNQVTTLENQGINSDSEKLSKVVRRTLSFGRSADNYFTARG